MKKVFKPEDALRHIAHDYAYLVAAGEDTQKPLSHPFNHYAERTFLVHCRTFDEFFNGRRHAMAVSHFTDGFVAPPIAGWNKWKRYINMHLMHLSTGRVTNAVIWTGEANKQLLNDFQHAWASFYRHLKPELEPLVRDELAKMETQFQGVHPNFAMVA